MEKIKPECWDEFKRLTLGVTREVFTHYISDAINSILEYNENTKNVEDIKLKPNTEEITKISKYLYYLIEKV